MTTHELREVRDRLLHLHKLLVEDVRGHYERLNGPIASPSIFLDLLVTDPFFAWLRVFSQLVVALDEGMEKDPPLSPETGFALIRARLVDADPGSEDRQKIDDALARLPEAKEVWSEISERVSV